MNGECDGRVTRRQYGRSFPGLCDRPARFAVAVSTDLDERLQLGACQAHLADVARRLAKTDPRGPGGWVVVRELQPKPAGEAPTAMDSDAPTVQPVVQTDDGLAG